MGPPPRLVLDKGKGRAVETAVSISPRVQSAVSKANPEVTPSDPKGKRVVKEITRKTQSVSDIPSTSGSNPLNPFADSAADDNEPGSVGTSSSDWNLNQSVDIKQAAQAALPKLDLSEQDHRESSSAAAAGAAAEEAVPSAAQGESQQKLNKKQRRAQQRKQAALGAAVAEASVSTSPADSPRAAEAAAATTAESAADQESQLPQPSPRRAVQPSAESSAAVGASPRRTELTQMADQSSKQLGFSVAPLLMGDLQLPPRPRPPPGQPRRRRPSVPDGTAESAPERPASPSLASATAALDAILPLPTAGAESPFSAGQLATDPSNSMWTVYQAGLYSDNQAELGYEPDLGHGPPPDYFTMPVRSTGEDTAAPAAAAAEGLPFAALDQLPSMSYGRLPSGTLDQLPSTSSPQLPTDVDHQLQHSTSGQLPSSASQQLLFGSLDEMLGVSDSQQPSTSSGQLIRNPSEQALPSRRGPELAEELQRALAVKPKPRASRAKAASKLPEPSRDLALQRELMEKPRPRARPPRVSRPSYEDDINGMDALTHS